MHKNYEVNLQDDWWGGEGGDGELEWRRAKLSPQRRLARDGKRIWSCALTLTYLSSCLREVRRGCDNRVRKVAFRTPRRRLGTAGTSFFPPASHFASYLSSSLPSHPRENIGDGGRGRLCREQEASRQRLGVASDNLLAISSAFERGKVAVVGLAQVCCALFPLRRRPLVYCRVKHRRYEHCHFTSRDPFGILLPCNLLAPSQYVVSF